MRFFEQQAIARRNSVGLIFVFIINVVILSAANAIVVGIVFNFSEEQMISIFCVSSLIFILATGLSLIGSRSGSRVAEMLGGRALQFPLKNSAEKRLHNVIEEMSIASGVAIQYTYVLDRDDSINAFAAGTDPKHFVIAVTDGAMTKLSRDELQAVIGHEFSHILNEDMELNVRTTGVVSGFYIFMKMGLWILRSLSGNKTSRRSKGDVTLAFGIAGLCFLIFGSIGYFLARILQSMISKQREFLADASSAQFTRNPEGLARALAKISYAGSEISSPNKLEVSHIFFAEGMSGFWTSLFSTHPSAEKRIQSLLPGVAIEKFIEELQPEFKKMDQDSFERISKENELFEQKLRERKENAKQQMQSRPQAQNFIASFATPEMFHFRFSEMALLKIPSEIRLKLQDAQNARTALFAAVLFTQDPMAQMNFLKVVESEHVDSMPFLKECLSFCSLNSNLRFIFLKVVLGILRQDKSEIKTELMKTLKGFFLQDQKFTILEALYFLICEHVLGPESEKTKLGAINDLRSVRAEIFRLLLAFEFPDKINSDTILQFRLKLNQREPLFVDVGFCPPIEFQFDLSQFKNDLKQLNRLSLGLKQKLTLILYENFKSDQVLTEQESDILRMILLYLKIPVPPMIENSLNGTLSA